MYLILLTKVAMGSMHENLALNGNLMRPDGTLLPGGIFIESQDLGKHAADRFAVIPEGRLQVGYAFTTNLVGFVGYNGMYVSSVARPGGQIDRVVNTPNIPSVSGRFAPSPPTGPSNF